MRTWERDDPDPHPTDRRPLDRCAELLGVELATVREAAATVELYLRADVTKQGLGGSCSGSVRSGAFGPAGPAARRLPHPPARPHR